MPPKREGRLRSDIDSLARRIAHRRLVKANKIDQAIGRLKERYPRVARYFDLAYDPHTATLAAPFNADKYTKAEQLDGCYLLKTDRTDLSGAELAHLHLAHPRRERLPRHEIAALRTPDLPSNRAPHRSPHLPLRARLPSADRDREDTPRPRQPHLLANRARHPQEPSNLHRCPANRRRVHAPHPQGRNPRTGGRGPLPHPRHRRPNHQA